MATYVCVRAPFLFFINQCFLYHSFFSAQEINGKFNNFNFDIFYMCI